MWHALWRPVQIYTNTSFKDEYTYLQQYIWCRGGTVAGWDIRDSWRHKSMIYNNNLSEFYGSKHFLEGKVNARFIRKQWRNLLPTAELELAYLWRPIGISSDTRVTHLMAETAAFFKASKFYDIILLWEFHIYTSTCIDYALKRPLFINYA